MVIKNERVIFQILDYAKERIHTGEWSAGQKIPSENQLAAELGVSRASVRSAYQYLTGLGVLVSRQGSGTFLVDCQVDKWDLSQSRITSADCRDIRQVLEFRRILEPEAARMAAERQVPGLVEELERWLGHMERWQGVSPRFVRADMGFHEAIACAAGNPLLEKSLRKVFFETRDNHEQLNVLVGDEIGIRCHAAILDAIRRGDGREAFRQMRQHMTATIRQVSAIEQNRRP